MYIYIVFVTYAVMNIYHHTNSRTAPSKLAFIALNKN